MSKCKYFDAYKSVKAPALLEERVLNTGPKTQSFNYKRLISIAACIIILAALFPAYVGFTDPSVSISTTAPMVARAADVPITLELNIRRNAYIAVSSGTIENYNGEPVKGDMVLQWNIAPSEYESSFLTVTDNLRVTVYVLSYNANNGSISITKLKGDLK